MAVLEFRSPACGGIFMMPATFQGICEVLERPYSESGCWLPEDLAKVIDKIEAAARREKELMEEARQKQREHDLKGQPGAWAWPEEEEEEKRKEREKVTFAMRAYPLLEMLRTAQAKGKKVMWGVP